MKGSSQILRKICGDCASVDSSLSIAWTGEVKLLLNGYDTPNILNTDEKCYGGKLSKDGITVLIACNICGSQALKPLIVVKSARPRCFKGEKTASHNLSLKQKIIDDDRTQNTYRQTCVIQITSLVLDRTEKCEKENVIVLTVITMIDKGWKNVNPVTLDSGHVDDDIGIHGVLTYAELLACHDEDEEDNEERWSHLPTQSYLSILYAPKPSERK
ncbi:uncharacterized protein LOC126235058 [Schistocerca nitens]|uniref:uncharacterized protein LOC126235058 n=1 Tax=Schistocerca nitens TaxID=7011 RepID=UPI0021192EF8|nr:uncharacterized protein LOC126235058 [Schistocerca nitens]